jgi:hypothetical protein
MTIGEAIKHCKEKQKELNEQACSEDMTEKEAADCLECATEHLQLATWLEELQEWRKLKAVCAFDGYTVYLCKGEQTKAEKPHNNAELFKQTFDIYATEVWAMSESKFLEWLNTEVTE